MEPTRSPAPRTQCLDAKRDKFVLGAETPIFVMFEVLPGVSRRSGRFTGRWEVGRRQRVSAGGVPHQRAAHSPRDQRHPVRALAIVPHDLGFQSCGNVGADERPSEDVVECGMTGEAAGARGTGESVVAKTVYWSPTRGATVVHAYISPNPETNSYAERAGVDECASGG